MENVNDKSIKKSEKNENSEKAQSSLYASVYGDKSAVKLAPASTGKDSTAGEYLPDVMIAGLDAKSNKVQDKLGKLGAEQNAASKLGHLDQALNPLNNNLSDILGKAAVPELPGRGASSIPTERRGSDPRAANDITKVPDTSYTAPEKSLLDHLRPDPNPIGGAASTRDGVPVQRDQGEKNMPGTLVAPIPLSTIIDLATSGRSGPDDNSVPDNAQEDPLTAQEARDQKTGDNQSKAQDRAERERQERKRQEEQKQQQDSDGKQKGESDGQKGTGRNEGQKQSDEDKKSEEDQKKDEDKKKQSNTSNPGHPDMEGRPSKEELADAKPKENSLVTPARPGSENKNAAAPKFGATPNKDFVSNPQPNNDGNTRTGGTSGAGNPGSGSIIGIKDGFKPLR